MRRQHLVQCEAIVDLETPTNASHLIRLLNPCTAELFLLYFHSFETGIANAISNFK